MVKRAARAMMTIDCASISFSIESMAGMLNARRVANVYAVKIHAAKLKLTKNYKRSDFRKTVCGAYFMIPSTHALPNP